MDNIIRMTCSIVDYQIIIDEYFIQGIKQSDDCEIKKRHAMEKRIQHVLNVAEKCLEIIDKNHTDVSDLVRDEIHMRYSKDGVVIRAPRQSNLKFKVLLLFNPRDWDRGPRFYCDVRAMCEQYSTERILISLEPIPQL